jgi:hypothetical protein
VFQASLQPRLYGYGKLVVYAYFTEHLRSAGEYDIGHDIRIHLLTSRDIPPTGTWGPSDWPYCR